MAAPCVIALGFFDGVHIGHGALLRRTVERAGQLGIKPAVVTFDRPPKEVVTGQPVALINSPQERQDLIRRLYGIEQVIFAPFDEKMMTMPWQDFITEVLVKQYGAVHLVAGHDYHFGHKNEGDPEKLQQKCAELGLGCDIIPKVELHGTTVSSTLIRALIEQGDVAQAAAYIGRRGKRMVLHEILLLCCRAGLVIRAGIRAMRKRRMSAPCAQGCCGYGQSSRPCAAPRGRPCW